MPVLSAGCLNTSVCFRAVGATAGGMFLVKWSVGFCMKDILALEGSPVQERFAAM